MKGLLLNEDDMPSKPEIESLEKQQVSFKETGEKMSKQDKRDSLSITDELEGSQEKIVLYPKHEEEKRKKKKNSKTSKKDDHRKKSEGQSEETKKEDGDHHHLEEKQQNHEQDDEELRRESESLAVGSTSLNEEDDNNSKFSMYMVPLELQEVVVHPLLQDERILQD
jgi:hypothetical protein